MDKFNSLVEMCRFGVRLIMRRIAVAINTFTDGKLSASAVTLVGLLGHVLVAYLIATRHPIWAAAFLVFFGLFDALDGELARLQNKETPAGMLMDSVSDRAKEVLLYTSVAYFFVLLDYPYVAVWAVAACGASLLVSYVNAWGEAVISAHPHQKHRTNQSFRSGLMSFDVRMVFLLIGLITSLLPEMLIVITVLSAFTAMGRVINIRRLVNVQD